MVSHSPELTNVTDAAYVAWSERLKAWLLDIVIAVGTLHCQTGAIPATWTANPA